MNRLLIIVSVVLLAATAQPGAQQTSGALDKLFASGQHKATVTGDLKGAIEDYKRIVSMSGKDRGAAAKALLLMAEAHQKLGDAALAVKTYERIVREFSEQENAVRVARTYTDTFRSTNVALVKGDRPIWTGPDVESAGTVSPDGRYVTYVDWSGAVNLMLRDLATNTSRPLTTNQRPEEVGHPITAPWSAMSRDGSHVAFPWIPAATKKPELRVADLRNTKPNSRVIATFGDRAARATDWSPDERHIAIVVENADRTPALGVVSVEDGTFRQLKSMGWGLSGKVVFSPDGRYLAYDFAAAETPYRRDVMVISVDASPAKDVPLVADGRRNYVMGWSQSGELLYSSDRSGSRSLWAVHIVDARAVGDPWLVRENVMSTDSRGLTTDGTLYVIQNASPSAVQTGTLDLTAGRILPAGARTFQHFVAGRSLPRWSADGRYLAFTSCDDTCALLIRDDVSGTVREVPHALGYFQSFSVAPDGHAIVAAGEDLKGRSGIYLIDAATGATTMVAPNILVNRYPEWSEDGRSIFYRETRGDTEVLVERQVADGQTADIYGARNGDDVSWMRVSPDRRFVGFIRHPKGDLAKEPARFIVASIAGGEERVIFTSPALHGQMWQWMSDSKSVILLKAVASPELWQIPLDGTARKLEVNASKWWAFHVSPSGRQIAFTSQVGDFGQQIWAIENVLPRR